MFRFLLLALFLLVIGLLVWLCDYAFKHLLWRLMSVQQALAVRWGAGLLCFLALFGALVYGHHYGRFGIEVHLVPIASKRVPLAFEGYRIAQISDLHLSSFRGERDRAFVRQVFDSVLAQKPDLIVFTGDLVTYQSQEAQAFRQELTHLAAHGIPVLSIMGNHDYADYTRLTPRQRLADRQQLRQLLAQCGWQVLDNRSLSLTRGSDTLQIVGVENVGEPPFATYGNLRKAMGGDLSAARQHFTLLLSHNPIHWRQEVLPCTHIDLTLSGHTHAMQFRLWGWSPVSWRYKEWGGLYAEGERWLYVNTGIGCTGPPVRLGVRPEISLFTLHHQPVSSR